VFYTVPLNVAVSCDELFYAYGFVFMLNNFFISRL